MNRSSGFSGNCHHFILFVLKIPQVFGELTGRNGEKLWKNGKWRNTDYKEKTDKKSKGKKETKNRQTEHHRKTVYSDLIGEMSIHRFVWLTR
ncbi:MAG: hypothetical protein ACLVAT_05275 [Lachnospiraceae bacterium]